MNAEQQQHRDELVCDFIRDYLRAFSYAPTVREVGRCMGVKSSSTAMVHLERMRRAGLVDWVDGEVRLCML